MLFLALAAAHSCPADSAVIADFRHIEADSLASTVVTTHLLLSAAGTLPVLYVGTAVVGAVAAWGDDNLETCGLLCHN